jgi:hypothetical protein
MIGCWTLHAPQRLRSRALNGHDYFGQPSGPFVASPAISVRRDCHDVSSVSHHTEVLTGAHVLRIRTPHVTGPASLSGR